MSTIEWIFSGVGAAVVAVLLERVISKDKAKTKTRNQIKDVNITSGNNNTVQIIEHQEQHLYQAKQDSAETIVLNQISPDEIKSTIDKGPLYQQDAIAKNFIGLNVSWKLKLFSISETKGRLKVIFNDQRIYPEIVIETNIEEHPYFKIAKQDDLFEVAGKIIDCEHYKILLDVRYIKELK